MRVINLCHGAGNGIDKACLLTASNMIMGKGHYLDRNDCVCPIISSFIMRTNDTITIPLLNKYYGPLAWEIIGTAPSNVEIIKKRLYKIASLHKYSIHSFYTENIPELILICKNITKELIHEFQEPSISLITSEYIVKKFADTIIEMCKIGDRRPVEAVLTPNELASALVKS